MQTTQEANSDLQAKLSEVQKARQALDDQLAEKETDFKGAVDAHKAASQELCKVKSVCYKAMQVCSISLAPECSIEIQTSLSLSEMLNSLLSMFRSQKELFTVVGLAWCFDAPGCRLPVTHSARCHLVRFIVRLSLGLNAACVCVQSHEAGREALQQQVAGKADEISALHAEVASLTSEKNAMSEVFQQCSVTCFHAFFGYHAFAA